MPKQQELEHSESNPANSDEAPSAGTGPGPKEPPIPVQYTSEFNLPAYDRRQLSVYSIDDFTFHSSSPYTTHWSVPWSDLMMTLFVLFLTLFVYQAEHKKLLVNDEIEVVGGDTTGALDIATGKSPSLPFAPIKPGAPLITTGTIKKVVPIHVEDIDVNTQFFNEKKENPLERIKKSVATPATPAKKAPERPPAPEDATAESRTELLTDQGTVEPQPITLEQTDTPGDDKISRLLGTISNTITRYKLDKYASVDLLSGTTVRILLSSDLFFITDKADLTSKSMASLQKIGAAIKNTPFMIDVVGHTDNQPQHSDRFPSNWELSVARASSVARFFMEETDMNPSQFVVSGFSSYRPLYPNTTTQNRAANRRIEVIISNKYPQPVMTSANKNQKTDQQQ
jgi:chemotaxis protein MotB